MAALGPDVQSALDRGGRGAGPASPRLDYLDNLKVLLIAAIIGLHAILGYVGLIEVWTYSEVRETTINSVAETALLIVGSPFGYMLIALLFLVSGLLAPASYGRKGPARFIRDRLLRLGVPFVVYVLVVQPALVYWLFLATGHPQDSYAEEFLSDQGWLDTGPLWFVGVLLVFSLVYAAYRAARDRLAPPRPTDRPRRPVTMRQLALVMLVVAPLSFAIRLTYPYGSESGFFDLNLWEWPACIAAFTLGIVGARRDWLTAVPDDLVRRCRAVTLVAVVAMGAVLTAVGLLDAVDEALGGWHWFAAAFVAVEAVLTIAGPVWLVTAARRRLARRYRHGPTLSRCSYGAFMVQTIALLGLAVALRPVPLPAEVKAVLVAVGAIAASFTVAWLLITKIPGVNRIL